MCSHRGRYILFFFQDQIDENRSIENINVKMSSLRCLTWKEQEPKEEWR